MEESELVRTPLSARKAERVPLRQKSRCQPATPQHTPQRLTASARALIEGCQFLGDEGPDRDRFSECTTPFRKMILDDVADVDASPKDTISCAARRYGSAVRLTPIRASKTMREQHGSDTILSPVRQTRSETHDEPSVRKLLEEAQWSYTPNQALDVMEEGARSDSPPCRRLARSQEWRESLAALRALAESKRTPPLSSNVSNI